jgi:hypothetical protein
MFSKKPNLIILQIETLIWCNMNLPLKALYIFLLSVYAYLGFFIISCVQFSISRLAFTLGYVALCSVQHT